MRVHYLLREILPPPKHPSHNQHSATPKFANALAGLASRSLCDSVLFSAQPCVPDVHPLPAFAPYLSPIALVHKYTSVPCTSLSLSISVALYAPRTALCIIFIMFHFILHTNVRAFDGSRIHTVRTAQCIMAHIESCTTPNRGSRRARMLWHCVARFKCMLM